MYYLRKKYIKTSFLPHKALKSFEDSNTERHLIWQKLQTDLNGSLLNCGLKQKPSTYICFREGKRKCVKRCEWKEWDSSYNRRYSRVCALMSAHAQRCCCTSWGAAVFGVGSSVRHGRDVGHESATPLLHGVLWGDISLCVRVWGCVPGEGGVKNPNIFCLSLRFWCISAI